jgi:hypothetical protein
MLDFVIEISKLVKNTRKSIKVSDIKQIYKKVTDKSILFGIEIM